MIRYFIIVEAILLMLIFLGDFISKKINENKNKSEKNDSNDKNTSTNLNEKTKLNFIYEWYLLKYYCGLPYGYTDSYNILDKINKLCITTSNGGCTQKIINIILDKTNEVKNLRSNFIDSLYEIIANFKDDLFNEDVLKLITELTNEYSKTISTIKEDKKIKEEIERQKILDNKLKYFNESKEDIKKALEGIREQYKN